MNKRIKFYFTMVVNTLTEKFQIFVWKAIGNSFTNTYDNSLSGLHKKYVFPVQTPLGAWPDLGTQPRYEAPGDLRVKYVKMQ